ncbi:MAG: FAD-binding oxidoreductase [Gemmatimonadales bacterium]
MFNPPPIRGIHRTDDRARAAYAEGAGIYRILPRGVALPADADDLGELVRWAGEQGQALIPRGAGSALTGANVGEGLVVDLTQMGPRRLRIHPEARTALSGAGVTLGELNRAASRHGLRLPPDPSSGEWATLGGMLSTNAAGPRSLRYGSVRRWVDAAAIVTADGEFGKVGRPAGEVGDGVEDATALRRFEAEVAPAIRAAGPLIRQGFPKTRKNASGYALDAYLESGHPLDLLVGAEGTLAFVTEIEWRLDPIPPARAALRVDLADLDALGEAVSALTRLQPAALELLDRTFLDLVSSSRPGTSLPEIPAAAQAILLVEFEGADPKALRDIIGDAVRAVEPWAIAVATALSEIEERGLWALRKAASPILAGLPESRRSMQVIEDGCVPVPRLGEYVRFIRKAAESWGITALIFGHAGDGNVHVNLLPEVGRSGWESRIAGLLDEVTGEVIRLGGTPSGEHGDGRLRAALLERLYGPAILSLFHRIKTAFDPRGILNPGVVLPIGNPPISRLKTGSGAAALPADVAAALRELERTGGYARPRLEIADATPGSSLPGAIPPTPDP